VTRKAVDVSRLSRDAGPDRVDADVAGRRDTDAGLPATPEEGNITLRVNGETVTVRARPTDLLLSVLRERLGLTGTKLGCGRGECGACTVLIDGRPVMSCIVMVATVAAEIQTVEGVAGETAALRRAFAETGAFQCGYCTPGQIVRGLALLREGLPDDDGDVRKAISGNICRCTGYTPIVAALRRAADETSE
jgi:aerobic-type carbon monoxide dehydrogenase small subunit (CoxS/CutS family)